MSVKVEHDGPVTIVTIDRPDARNAVDRPTAEALAHAFREFDEDDARSVAVLTGAGGFFCAGADLKAMGEEGAPRANRVAEDGDGPMGPSRMVLSKPVIAAVEGYAVAGGLELALWCDMRVLEEDAFFGVYCRRWGVPLIDGGTVRLPRIVGMGRAMDLILTGRKVTADEAFRIGLCERVVPRGKAREEAEKLAHEIARFPQGAVRCDRRSAYETHGLPVREALEREWLNGVPVMAEAVQGAATFASGKGRHGDFTDI